jgi:hypothetical protein
MNPRQARFVDIGLGAWLIVSAILLHQSSAHSLNTLLTGIVVVLSAVVGLRVPVARYVTSAAGVWLIASLFAWPTIGAPTIWNNFFVGVGIALSSVIGPIQAWSPRSDQIDSTA